MENKINYQKLLTEQLGSQIEFNPEKPYEVYTTGENLLKVLELLKKNGLGFLVDISSADYQEYFEVVYQLYSFESPDYLTVKVKLDHENPQVNSVFSLWDTADWLEREVYDLMGITFLNHPCLERILMWEGFEGHPLRKDYVSKSKRK